MCLGWRISAWHGWMPSYCISNLPNDSVQRTFSPARPSTSLPNNRFQLKNIVPLQIEFKIYGMIRMTNRQQHGQYGLSWWITTMQPLNLGCGKSTIKSACLLSPVSLWALRLCAPGFPAQHDITCWLSSELKWSKCNENHWLFIQIMGQIDTNCKFVRKTIGMLAPSHCWRSWTGRSNSSQDPEPSWVPEKIWKECLTPPRLCGSCFNMFLTPWTSIFAKMEIEKCWTAKASRSPKVM